MNLNRSDRLPGSGKQAHMQGTATILWNQYTDAIGGGNLIKPMYEIYT